MTVIPIFSANQKVTGVQITTAGFEGLYILTEDNQGANPAPTSFNDNAQPTPTELNGTLIEFPQLTSAMVGVTCDASQVVADNNGSFYLKKAD